MSGAAPSRLDLDESERNGSSGGIHTLTVAGIAYQYSDARAIEREIGHLKGSLGLDAEDELKYNMGDGHPSRLKMVKAGYDQKARIPRSLEKLADWPIRIIGHVEIFGAGSHPDSQVGHYLAGVRETVRTYASALEPAASSGQHEVRIDYPSHAVGQKPFREYQAMYQGELQELGFAPALLTTPASVSPLIQMADIVVGCVSEYVTDKARSLIRGSAYRPTHWPTENFSLIAQKAFLRDGSLGITVTTDSEQLAEALRDAIVLDGILADGVIDPITPVRIFARPLSTKDDQRKRTNPVAEDRQVG